MDTSDYPSLPSLTRIHAQLAAQARRVDKILGGPSDVIERLFHATIAEDWKAVTAATHELANLKPEEMGVEVISEARKLYQELSHDAQLVKQPKHLAPLLAACRTARSRTRTHRLSEPARTEPVRIGVVDDPAHSDPTAA